MIFHILARVVLLAALIIWTIVTIDYLEQIEKGKLK